MAIGIGNAHVTAGPLSRWSRYPERFGVHSGRDSDPTIHRKTRRFAARAGLVDLGGHRCRSRDWCHSFGSRRLLGDEEAPKEQGEL
ncbi:hypothetical protein PG994_015067 [Apiospora phragmitis]|uniref:Uncharacterized protein n=1 Tax=Apiospora phragmitis TaxID=2905665 RepID=A0ABR1SX83_9PEZI